LEALFSAKVAIWGDPNNGFFKSHPTEKNVHQATFPKQQLIESI